MKNPLHKRIPREFVGELSKYIVIFAFMVLSIGFISGFLVADSSMLEAYNNSFEKYHVEDGNFELVEKASKDLIADLEKEDVKIYNNFYYDKAADFDEDNKKDATIRVFENRTEVNKVCLMSGKLPKDENEIAIDRMFADNNELVVGDKITIDKRELTVCGLIALSDYSTLFSNNADTMFDATKFGAGVMTEDGFAALKKEGIHYSYSWTYNKAPKNEEEEIELSDDFIEVLAGTGFLENCIPQYANKAIQFTGNDMGSDKGLMATLLYVLIVVMAFVFAVTISNTIVKEANVIGTLRASGYTRGELLRHYLAIPLVVTFTAAIVGNILGYTIFEDITADLYYSSYSLTTYETIWNSSAFITTTVVPLFIMFVVNAVLIYSKLRISPLQLLRRQLQKTKRKKALKLPHFKFFTRFRIRIILQNLPNYVTLLLGITFANVLLLFGIMLPALLTHFEEVILEEKIANYQYVLKAPMDTKTEGAEAYHIFSLKSKDELFGEEEITAYGIVNDSDYIDVSLPDEGAYISYAYADKYGFEKGDTITLKENYGSNKYNIKVEGIYHYEGALCIYMSEDAFCDMFDEKPEDFDGYFSNKKINDIDKNYIATTITEEELTKLSRQLMTSMGGMCEVINWFCFVLFALLMYLMTKLIIEKNTNAVSMVKILGYENREINRLYLRATTIATILSEIISLFLATWILTYLYKYMMAEMSGWIVIYIKKENYIFMFLIAVVAYLFVALLQMRKIKKIPMDEALKNVE